MTKLKDWLIAAAVLVVGRGDPPERHEPKERIVAAGPPDRRAENVVLLLFVLATLAAAAFIVVYALDRLSHQTQWLGLAIGAAFALLALASTVIAHRLVVTEEISEPYPEESADAQEEIEQIVEESGSRFTRKRLVTVAGVGALGTLGAALLAPAASLGPVLHTGELYRVPWRRGRRLVDEGGRPLTADEIEEGTFYTAYPAGADRELIGAPIVVVRLPLEEIRDRRDWAPRGIVAYSKICTHAGCAVALYRKPTFAAVEPRPALVCPCHYSTFDPASGGAVLFGPAGRPLPQLPLQIDRNGQLRAAGTFSDPVGPSWWGVRMGKARS
ncbi:MAG: Rieske 2Fe-2S domain-containing protein [Gaiellaceae bacterium]